MRILIVEDEPKAASLMKELVESYDPKNEVVAIFDSIEGTLSYLKTKKVDLFFMDIQVADGLSFEIFKKTTIVSPVIFCTAYDRYALEAFKSNGIDYILKPFQERDISNAFKKLEQIRGVNLISDEVIDQITKLIQPPKEFNSAFLIKTIDKIYPVAVNEIAYALLENGITHLVTFKNEKHIILKTIDEIEASLDPHFFFRINRQMIIERSVIAVIEPFFNRKVALKLKLPIADKPVVSRLKVSSFLRWMEKA